MSYDEIACCDRAGRVVVDLQMMREYLIESVDDAAVVQLYADAFTSLPLREKILVWHLYLAALAGRDIYYDQRHPRGLEMRLA